MKTIKSFLVGFCIFILPIFVNGQSDFKKGSVITSNSEELSGTIKESFKSKGTITFLSINGKKNVYSPWEIVSFNVDTVNFISYSNDFYKELSCGTKICLYQKVTNNRDKILYNGNEVAGFAKTTEGKAGDYYVLAMGKKDLDLITKTTFAKYFLDLSKDNNVLQEKIKDGSLGYTQIVKVVELFNNSL